MKNIKNFLQKALGLGLIATIILTQSCKKSFLNVDPAGNQKAATFYKTQDDATAAVSAMYASLHSYASVAFPALAIESMGSGDVDKGSVPSDASFMNDFIKFNVTAGEGQVPDFWNGECVIINLANQNLDNIPAINMDASLKARYLAESKFIRAWAYFRLVRAYGDVPLRLHIPKDATEYNLPRTPKAQVYAAIEQDLTDAAGVLPQSYSGADIGRITKGAALSLHAKVAMYQQKWPDVLTYTNSVISSGAYSLFPDYEQMFRTTHKNNSESIFEIQTSYIASNSVANVSQYAQVQGARIANGGWGFNVPNAALAAAFEPGDPRKDATFLNEGETTPEGDVIPTGLDNPAYNQKTYVPFAIVLSQPDGPYGVSQDYIAIRYADVLLMNAEAKNESGDAAGALVSLNMVRARARLGAPSGTLPDITVTDKTALRTAIWHERRVELALEFDHYFDVIRRGDAEATAEFGGRGWKAGKNEVWPIPQNEIDLSAGTLVQNPGY
jgi:starch-binding outer membrane protein, SusD/RagB family